jgi:hypothetical protein
MEPCGKPVDDTLPPTRCRSPPPGEGICKPDSSVALWITRKARA